MAKSRTPSLCLHRPTGQAFVTITQGKKRSVKYLGKWGTEQSLTAYAAALTESGFSPEEVSAAVISARPSTSLPQPVPVAQPAPTQTTFRSLYDHFMQWAPGHYRLPSGEVSKEVDNFRYSFAVILLRLGTKLTADLTKRDLEQTRDAMISKGLSRKVINQRFSRILHVIRWGTEENRGLVPDAVAAALLLLAPLEAFRTKAPEKDAVVGIDPQIVAKVIKVANPVVAAMLQLQLFTGMRPGEVRGLRKCMVVQREGDWVADFGIEHKMAYRKQLRIIPLGERTMELLNPWIAKAPFPRSFLFRPELNRKSTQKSQQYSRAAYGHSVAAYCKKAKVLRFGPNRIRHTVGEEVRRSHGLDHVQALLGHKNRQSSERYAPVVEELAKVVAKKRG